MTNWMFTEQTFHDMSNNNTDREMNDNLGCKRL